MLIKNDPNLSTYFSLLGTYFRNLNQGITTTEIFEKLFFIPTTYNNFAPKFQEKIDFLNYIENYLEDITLAISFDNYNLENPTGCNEVYSSLKDSWIEQIFRIWLYTHKVTFNKIQILKDKFFYEKFKSLANLE